MAKPVPRPTPTEQPFYDACAAGKLVLQHCQNCGHVLFYPRTHCDACQSDQLLWEDASGAGTIASSLWCVGAFPPTLRRRISLR